jgi:hypothetical protein
VACGFLTLVGSTRSQALIASPKMARQNNGMTGRFIFLLMIVMVNSVSIYSTLRQAHRALKKENVKGKSAKSFVPPTAGVKL